MPRPPAHWSTVTSPVREHPAPSGALRLIGMWLLVKQVPCQGAPSTIRCIKTRVIEKAVKGMLPRQGAPSTIRCIKTRVGWGCHTRLCICVREHPAPSGALRPTKRRIGDRLRHHVREHPAPSGALRHIVVHVGNRERSQGAPSTIRCIKTSGAMYVSMGLPNAVREHPAPSGALRLSEEDHRAMALELCQGAPSTIRCIKTSSTFHFRSTSA